jgi:hypothetical protein
LLLSASIGGPVVAGALFIMPRLVLAHGVLPLVFPVTVRGIVEAPVVPVVAVVPLAGVPPLFVPFVVVVVEVLPFVCVAVVVVPLVVTVVLFVVPAAVFVDVVGTVPVDVVPLQLVIVEFGTVAGVPGGVWEAAGNAKLAAIATRVARPKSCARGLMPLVLPYRHSTLKLS